MQNCSFDQLLSQLDTPAGQNHLENSTPSPWFPDPASNPRSVLSNGKRFDSLEELISQCEPDPNQTWNGQVIPSSYPLESRGSNSNLPPDVMEMAATSSGLKEYLEGSHTDFPGYVHDQGACSYQAVSAAEADESIEFKVQPDDVHFRYKTEVQRSNTSPIRGKAQSAQFPLLQVCNLKPTLQYYVEVTLVDEQSLQSIHELYKTRDDRGARESGGDRTIPWLRLTVPQNGFNVASEISIENIGIQRKSTRGDPQSQTPRMKKGPKDGQDSVHLLASLYIVDNIRNASRGPVAHCLSDKIHDVKKATLKINHINPRVGMEAGKQEVTILCSKIKDDTEVKFSVYDDSAPWEESATILTKHHGVAMVVLVPPCPAYLFRNSNSVTAHVTLFCPATQRSSEAMDYTYKMDVFSPYQRFGLDRQRSRSPVRGQADVEYGNVVFQQQGGLETDSSLASQISELSLKEEPSDSKATIGRREPGVVSQKESVRRPKMVDLSRVRAVARGEEEWSQDVDKALVQSPFVLHVQNSNGLTPLTEALTTGREEIFTRFLESMEEDERNQIVSGRPYHGASLLHMVSVPENMSVRVVKHLLQRGADPRTLDRNGQTVLHWLVQRSRVPLLKETLTAFRRWFRDNGENESSELRKLVDKIDNEGRSALHTAIIYRVVTAVEVLLEADADIHLPSPHNGYTALHWATGVEDEMAVKLLLRKGARRRSKSKHGSTAFQMAVQANHEGLMTMLRPTSPRRSSADSGSPSS